MISQFRRAALMCGESIGERVISILMRLFAQLVIVYPTTF